MSTTKSNSTGAVYVAYVTAGREKYEYKTHFAGVHKTAAGAYKALYNTLVGNALIRSPADANSEVYVDVCTDLTEKGRAVPSELEPVRLAKRLEGADDDEEARLAFTTYCKWYGDSFEGDGWDWTLKEVPLESFA